MTMRFLTSLTIFAIACILQFLFVPVGITINFIFATLIAFSFVFSGYGIELLEFIFFILASIFLMNWLPVPSFALAAFAAIPVIIYFIRTALPWEAWTGIIVSLLSGFVLLYLVTAPRFIIADTQSFIIDLLTGIGSGLLVFLCMDREFGEE